MASGGINSAKNYSNASIKVGNTTYAGISAGTAAILSTRKGCGFVSPPINEQGTHDESGGQRTEYTKEPWYKRWIKTAATIVHIGSNELQGWLKNGGKTYSVGVDVSLIILGINPGGQQGVGIDSNGTVFYYTTKSGGAALAEGGAALTVAYTKSNVPTYEQLEAWGVIWGGSAGVPIDGVPLAFGFERTYLSDEDGFAAGKSGTIMIGVGTPGKEVHAGASYTSVHKLGKPFDAIDKLYENIMGW